jgi:hypothetical protein
MAVLADFAAVLARRDDRNGISVIDSAHAAQPDAGCRNAAERVTRE